jgi:hypothetical protein
MKLEQTLSHGTYIKEVAGKDIPIPRLNPSHLQLLTEREREREEKESGGR